MNFLQCMYTAFFISMALLSVAAIITYRNDLTVNMPAFWLILTAIPFFTVGMPAFGIRHSGIFDPDKERRQERRTE